VNLGDADEDVLIDPVRGPMVYQLDGSMGFLLLSKVCFRATAPDLGFHKPHGSAASKQWVEMTSTEREIQLLQAAKRNRARAELKGRDFFRLPPEAPSREEVEQVEEEVSPEAAAADAAEAEAMALERIRARCAWELARAPLMWSNIDVDTVVKNQARKTPGLLYGLEFPWTETMLLLWGPEWLTKAFHAAGTLDPANKVTKIIPEKKTKVTTGNNGGKFLFEVVYANKDASLHTKLFAKVPFPLEGATRSDRLSSSVNKQPQELYEINTYRLLEATLPVKIPRYYYGDISNETSNWILITERVPFTSMDPQNFGKPKPRQKPIAPWVIEGPYDKCMDHNLRGDPKEYYMLLVRTGAKIAGLHKAGALGSWECLSANFQNMAGRPVESWGLTVNSSSGEDPRQFKTKLGVAVDFVCDVGKMLFPDYASDEAFSAKLRQTMFLMNAWSAEIKYWKHVNEEYIALTHQNMNVDNAYFWRNPKGKLDLGVFDWGGMGAMSLGHKLWWWLYCSDYELFNTHVHDFIDAFNTTYEEHGGPRLSGDVMYKMVIITALEQMVGLCNAVPQVYKMCPKKEWPTIENRYDPRIAKNVDGKSTLRLYLHVMNSVVRIIEEMNGDAELDTLMQEVLLGQFGHPGKDMDIVTGEVKAANVRM